MISSQKSIQNDYGFYVRLTDHATIDQAIKHCLAAQLKKPNSDTGVISPIASNQQLGIPYLTIRDNLHLSIQKKAVDELKMNQLLAKLALQEDTFRKTLKNLSLLDMLKLQLLSAYCRGKKQIIIANIFPALSTKEIQWLLPVLQEFANQEKIYLLVYTTDEKIANSPYVDYRI